MSVLEDIPEGAQIDIYPSYEPKISRIDSIVVDEQPLYDYLKDHTVHRVTVEGPGYVSPAKLSIAEKLTKQGIEVVLSGNILWGSCCIGWDLAQVVDSDLIVHVGHDPYVASAKKVVYLPVVFGDEEVVNALFHTALELIEIDGHKTVELLASLEFMVYRDKLISRLRERGIDVLPSGHPGGTTQDGQILACVSRPFCSSEAKGTPIIALADGFFASGVQLDTRRPVLSIDPYRDRIFWLDNIDPLFVEEREIVLDIARHARTFGVLIETRKGQLQLNLARGLVQEFHEIGRNCIIVGVTEVTPLKLGQYSEIDIWINTTCKRLVTDHKSMLRHKSITLEEAMCLLERLRDVE